MMFNLGVTSMANSIRSRLFYTIRNIDVELAESFAARCPEVSSVKELNKVLHRLLAQYEMDTLELRSKLSDDVDVDLWICRFFNEGIFDFLKRHRLPPLTGNWDWGVYSGCSQTQ